MEQGGLRRILIARTDRVGDVLLTTPVSRLLRQHFPAAIITWLARSYTAPLFQHNPDVDRVIVDDGGPVQHLVQRVKAEHFDVGLVAYPRWRICYALWRAGIPRRIGPASKIYSLLLTERLAQHRSEGKKHEADYNIDLLEPLGIPFQRVPMRFVLTPEEESEARKALEGYGLSLRKRIVALHPGSGGSSSRWPLKYFLLLADRLQKADCDVVVTSGPGEDYPHTLFDEMERAPVCLAAGSLSLRGLGALLKQSDLVVTNSTGPLHLAVALGVPTVSMYSPIVTCHPNRWGPYPAFVEADERHTVLVAPDQGLREGEMALISVDQVWDACQRHLIARPRAAAQ